MYSFHQSFVDGILLPSVPTVSQTRVCHSACGQNPACPFTHTWSGWFMIIENLILSLGGEKRHDIWPSVTRARQTGGTIRKHVWDFLVFSLKSRRGRVTSHAQAPISDQLVNSIFSPFMGLWKEYSPIYGMLFGYWLCTLCFKLLCPIKNIPKVEMTGAWSGWHHFLTLEKCELIKILLIEISFK